jgi:hypothetical protein
MRGTNEPFQGVHPSEWRRGLEGIIEDIVRKVL